ncbi:MAG: hypothetical protein V1874_01210 [Spirochaetota bacterium]
MKKLIPFILILPLVAWFFDDDEKKEMVEKKWFKNDNTFVIICKGWPKESLTGQARIDSAKEAALMNAQFTTKDLFSKPVDVVKFGTIENYKIYDKYVTIQYVITYTGLRRYYKG